MREGINGHVAAEHAPLGTEHLHQRHYPRLQLLLVPIHAEDAFHGRDADTGVTASADGVQVGLAIVHSHQRQDQSASPLLRP